MKKSHRIGLLLGCGNLTIAAAFIIANWQGRQQDDTARALAQPQIELAVSDAPPPLSDDDVQHAFAVIEQSTAIDNEASALAAKLARLSKSERQRRLDRYVLNRALMSRDEAEKIALRD